MTVNIVTSEDLQNFKKELLAELASFMDARPAVPVKWLKSYQVKELLGLSSATLQTLRINGTLSYTKIGGLIFYCYDDIIKMMEKDKKNAKQPTRKF
jgi:hypothetical protein